MNKKGYMIREGAFYTDWEIYKNIIFTTKKKAHDYMRKELGFGCYKSKKKCYIIMNEDVYENIMEEYGYELIGMKLI